MRNPVLLSGGGTFSGGPGGSTEAKVYISGGQSNDLGQIPLGQMPTYLNGPRSNVQIWYDNGTTAQFEAIDPWDNTRHFDYNPGGSKNGSFGNKVGWGPGIESTYRWGQDNSNPIYYIKNAYGGEEISEWDVGNQRWTDLTTYLTNAKAAIEADSKTWSVQSFMWIQGESDCTATLAPLYEDALIDLITRIRALPEIPSGMPFFIVKLRSDCWNQNATFSPYVPQIRAAQDAVVSALSDVYMIDPEALGAGFQSDDLHYDADGAVKIGYDWYDQTNNIINGTVGDNLLLYSQMEYIQTLGLSTADEELALALRYATKIVSSGAKYVPSPEFTLPSGVTWQDEETFVDETFRIKWTIVQDGGRIKNPERWIVNDAGIAFFTRGSSWPNRAVRFYQHGARYPVLGQTGSDPHELTLATNGSDSLETSKRASTAWFWTDSIIAWVDGNDHVTSMDILTGATGPEVTITGQTINLNTMDGNDVRRPYTDPFALHYRQQHNLTATEGDTYEFNKVYRMLPVSTDKRSYVVLVYTISTNTIKFLTGGAVPTESDTPVVHTITEGTSIDYMTLSQTGKRIIGQVDNDGMGLFYINGTKLAQLYGSANHTGYGPGLDKQYALVKLVGSNPDNPILGGSSGDMCFVKYEGDGSREGVNCVILPSGDTATETGGDQSGNGSAIVTAYACGASSNPRETWSQQMIVCDPSRSKLVSPDDSKYGRYRILVDPNPPGSDDDDPAFLIGNMYESPHKPGYYQVDGYLHTRNVDGTHDGILHCELQIPPDTDDFATLKTALSNSDLVSEQ